MAQSSKENVALENDFQTLTNQPSPIQQTPLQTYVQPCTGPHVTGGLPVPNPTPAVGPCSMEIICPYCRCRIKTNVRRRSSIKTHIACLLLCWTGCCCLPYCMDTCNNANHFCPMCRVYLGTYQS